MLLVFTLVSPPDPLELPDPLDPPEPPELAPPVLAGPVFTVDVLREERDAVLVCEEGAVMEQYDVYKDTPMETSTVLLWHPVVTQAEM